MSILSLFDGMSCGQIALKKCKINYEKYFSSEIDEKAIKVTQHNFPETIQIGDVIKIKCSELPEIDLLMGGSPCQSFSPTIANNTGFDGKSKLFLNILEFLKKKNQNILF
jgi:DNA (cytosine-5)-methyltransferase 3A